MTNVKLHDFKTSIFKVDFSFFFKKIQKPTKIGVLILDILFSTRDVIFLNYYYFILMLNMKEKTYPK